MNVSENFHNYKNYFDQPHDNLYNTLLPEPPLPEAPNPGAALIDLYLCRGI